jgi:hypothetical protein
MSAGETAANKAVEGFVVGERVTLTTSPAATTSTAWTHGAPGPSARAKSVLSSTSGASTSFTPDVAGSYVVTATVDGTTSYSLVLSVTDIVISTLAEALRIQAKTASSVPAPTAKAVAAFVSRDIAALSQKTEGGQVTPIVAGSIGALLTDADESVAIASGVHRTLPTLTGNRTKTLATSGASTGHIVEIHRVDLPGTNTCAIVNGGLGGGTLFTFQSGELHTASFRFDGTNWALWERRKLG